MKRRTKDKGVTKQRKGIQLFCIYAKYSAYLQTMEVFRVGRARFAGWTFLIKKLRDAVVLRMKFRKISSRSI